MSLNLSLKDVLHHGAEGVAFLALGTYAFSNLSSTCIAYGIGKVTCESAKVLLDLCPRSISSDTKRMIALGVSALTTATIYQVSQSEMAGKSVRFFSTLISTLGVAAASIGASRLADKWYENFATTPNEKKQLGAE